MEDFVFEEGEGGVAAHFGGVVEDGDLDSLVFVEDDGGVGKDLSL